MANGFNVGWIDINPTPANIVIYYKNHRQILISNTKNVFKMLEVSILNRGTKIGLLCFFIPCEVIFAVCTIPALFIYLPVGIIGVIVTAFYGLIIASIFQSLKGKKPIFNLFREGQKTCKKCGYTYEKRTAFSCPRCAEEKRKNQPPLPTYEEIQAVMMERKARKADFWNAIGNLAAISELSQKPPLKKKSVLNSTYYDHEHLHTEEGHETEDGYCMECDMPVEDILE